MDGKLLEILACPICKGPVEHVREKNWLVCRADRLAFPVRDDIPVMLEEEAQALDMDLQPKDRADNDRDNRSQ